MKERREHRRAKVRLPVELVTVAGQDVPVHGLWTDDISAGGILFEVVAEATLPDGAPVAFELHVPPGDGYSASTGRIKGVGRVVRTVRIPDRDALGVALRFTDSLGLEF